MPIILIVLTLIAILSALSSLGAPPYWPWGLHAAIVLLGLVTLLTLFGVKA